MTTYLDLREIQEQIEELLPELDHPMEDLHFYNLMIDLEALDYARSQIELNITCEHEEHEDCLICAECGECSESLNDYDICSSCDKFASKFSGDF